MKAAAMPSALASSGKTSDAICEDDYGDATTAASTAEESFESRRYDDDVCDDCEDEGCDEGSGYFSLDDDLDCHDEDEENLYEDAVDLPRRSQDLDLNLKFKIISHLDENQREIFAEFSDRGRQLLERENSPDHRIVDYFAEFPSNSYSNSKTAPNAKCGHPGSPLIDRDCRSKMLEWAFKLLDLSFPPSEDLTLLPSGNISNPRQHSIEAISIAYQAFSYVDRVSSGFHLRESRASSSSQSQSQSQSEGKNLKERSNYKLLCMVSLHLACKSSGFFRFSVNECRYPEREVPQFEGNGARYSLHGSFIEDRATEPGPFARGNEADDASYCYHLNDPMNDWSFMTYESSYSSLSSLSSTSSTIDPSTDNAHHHSNAHQSSNPPKAKARPYMDLLSLAGLVTLAQGEFTISDLLQMELDILFDMNWKMLSATPMDWIHLMMEVIAAMDIDGVNTDEVYEHCISQLERIAEKRSEDIMTIPPSLLAMAVMVNALDVRGQRECPVSDGSFNAKEWSGFVQYILGLNHHNEELRRLCDLLKGGC